MSSDVRAMHRAVRPRLEQRTSSPTDQPRFSILRKRIPELERDSLELRTATESAAEPRVRWRRRPWLRRVLDRLFGRGFLA